MDTPNQRGFSALELVIAVLVVAAIAVTGYFAYNSIKDGNSGAPTAAEQTEQAVTPSAPAVEDEGDLDRALEVLDETNLDASETDAAELDSQTGDF